MDTFYDVKHLVNRLKENEETVKKFHSVESKILSILEFNDLFEVLLSEIKKQFNIPFVWISIIKKTEISDFIKSPDISQSLKKNINLITEKLFLELIGKTMEPVLSNKDLTSFFKLFPKNNKFFIKSIAVAPLSLDGKIIGSLNLGDFLENRFHPGIDKTLLEQLAIKVSLCLSNVTAHEKLKFFAFHDALTGVLNRRIMETILQREFNRAKRYQAPLSVVFADLNRFKQVNDQYGHSCGDNLLKYVANTLTKMSRETDVVTRFAGDEFVIILPETEPKSADNLMKRIQSHLRKNPFNFEEKDLPVSLCFGIASTQDKTIRDPDIFLKKADDRLYRQKNKVKKLTRTTKTKKK